MQVTNLGDRVNRGTQSFCTQVFYSDLQTFIKLAACCQCVPGFLKLLLSATLGDRKLSGTGRIVEMLAMLDFSFAV